MAFVSGPSFAARRGIVMKGVAVLERLARCMTVLIDKTGTPTVGHPQLDHALQCAALAHHDGGMTVNLATAAASKYRRSGLLVLLRGMRRTI